MRLLSPGRDVNLWFCFLFLFLQRDSIKLLYSVTLLFSFHLLLLSVGFFFLAVIDIDGERRHMGLWSPEPFFLFVLCTIICGSIRVIFSFSSLFFYLTVVSPGEDIFFKLFVGGTALKRGESNTQRIMQKRGEGNASFFFLISVVSSFCMVWLTFFYNSIN